MVKAKKLIIWLLIGCVLIGGLVLAKRYYWQVTEREVPRLSSDDPQKIKEIVAAIKQDSAYSVVFIGDSAVYSSVSRQDQQTIASYYATALARRHPFTNIAVYDLSLPGCSFPATYELSKYLLENGKPELVIADINPGWLGSSKMEHLVLRDLNSGRKTPGREVAQVPEFPPDLYRPWFEKNFAYLQGQPKLGTFAASKHNPQWMAYQQQAALFSASDSRALFFLPPRNRALYEQYNLIDDSVYADKVKLIRTQLPSNIMFADYTWQVDSSLFSDLTHMFPAGNQILANLLAGETARLN
ncbi:MAG: hypothetical protein ACM3NT_11140 [Methylocystaceae bacterium]